MRQAIKRAVLVLLMTMAVFPLMCVEVASLCYAETASAGYLENVFFERLPGKERVRFSVTKISNATIDSLPGNAVIVRMENLYVSKEQLRSHSDPALSNVIQVTPVQKVIDGKSWVFAQVDLKQKVPCHLRQEGLNILIDFDVTFIPVADASMSEKSASASTTAQQAQPIGTTARAGEIEGVPAVMDSGQKDYTGARIFLDVQDADIKQIFRLLAEQGKVSIVSGDDVKGNLTLSMKNVPWDQAFQTILDLKGLDQTREGNIITVVTLDRKKKDEDDRLAAEATRQKAEDEKKARKQKKDLEQGKRKQIVIEAKIVEMTTNFARELGINWGYGYRDSWNGRDMGVLIGNSSSGTVTTLPSGIGLTTSNAAVNFPSIAGIASPGIGLVLGSSKFILDAKLSALEDSGEGKIISSPKVTTLDNQKAVISQGKEVPVVKPATSTEPSTVEYKDVTLSLSVTPEIMPKISPQDEGRISLDINVTNKDIDESLTVQGNPAFNSSEVKSKVVVRDGDTIVVGGIYKTVESFAQDGIPWLSDIPVLGWLFKSEVKKKETREINVFITPRIVKDES